MDFKPVIRGILIGGGAGIFISFVLLYVTGTGWQYGLNNRPYPYIAVLQIVACPPDAPCYFTQTSKTIGNLDNYKSGFLKPSNEQVEIACDDALENLKKVYPKATIWKRTSISSCEVL